MKGAKPRMAVNLDIWGDDLPLDDKLLNALPPKYYPVAHSFHPAGKGDFKAFIRRQPDDTEFDNRFLVTFHDATLRYDFFPYPLEDVSGVLDIQRESVGVPRLPRHPQGRRVPDAWTLRARPRRRRRRHRHQRD